MQQRCKSVFVHIKDALLGVMNEKFNSIKIHVINNIKIGGQMCLSASSSGRFTSNTRTSGRPTRQTDQTRADELTARGSNTVRGKISFARDIHGCPVFFYVFFQRKVFISSRIYVYIHISDCLEIVYELPFLPNNTASEVFLHRLGAVLSVDQKTEE